MQRVSLAAAALCLSVALPSSAFAYVSPQSPRYDRAVQQGSSSVPVSSGLPGGYVSQEDQLVRMVERSEPAVVSVVVSKDLPAVEQMEGGALQSRIVGAGSAFFVTADGLLLTNNHVVEDAGADYTVLVNDGSKLNAKVVYRNAATDVALLQVQGRKFTVLPLAAGDTVHLAQIAVSIGNALGEFRNTVSVGVVSGLRRSIRASGLSGGGSETIKDAIQTDAAINEGNSGGPLLNSRGEVIGMNVAIASGAQSVGFALPVKQLRAALKAYRAQ